LIEYGDAIQRQNCARYRRLCRPESASERLAGMNLQAIESQVHQQLDAMRADIIRFMQGMVAFKSN
jgi:hypothetical protein